MSQSQPPDDFTFHDPEEDFGEPSFEDELEFEAEIEREAAANFAAAPPVQQPSAWVDEEEVEAAAADGAPADEMDVDPIEAAIHADYDADVADDAAASEPDVASEVDVPPREVRSSFLVPVELEDGRCSSRELRLLVPRPKASLADVRAAETGSLLATPISELRDMIDREAAAEASAAKVAAAAAAAEAAEATEAGGADEPSNSASNVAANEGASQAAATSGELWVDKYAPRAFMDLLSDERLNRHVLRWVKQWDPLVFGQPKGRRGSAAAPVPMRPERPILLISGPPGLGKTTLAHIVARHAGYRPDEINASDERSAKVLKQRVTEASENQSVFSDRRPPLIVIDEVDGAMGGPEGTSAVNELIKLANATVAKAADAAAWDAALPSRAPPPLGARAKKDAVGDKKTGEKKAPSGLMRPVICICNDLHAPALRPLRAVAELVEFRSASNTQLIARLKTVCRSERMAADGSTLTSLANLSGQDVRTCLNTLQFVRAKSSVLTEASLESSGVGKKSIAKSSLQLWRQVFNQPPKRKRSAKATQPHAAPPSKAAMHAPPLTQQRSRVAANAGAPVLSSSEQLLADLELADVGRVLEGVVENYLGIGFTDPTVSITAAAAEALSVHDMMSTAQWTKGHHALGSYAKTTVVAMHTLCAVPSLREQLVFPKSEREHRNKMGASRNLLHSWHAGLTPSLYQFYTCENLLVDVLTPLLTILTPPIKPTAMHLLNNDERKVLHDVVDRMIAFGLRYSQTASDEGGYQFKLDPPICDLLPPNPNALEYEAAPMASSFGSPSGASASTGGAADGAAVRELPAAVRQLLGTELQREQMRRHHAHQQEKRDAANGGDGSSSQDKGSPSKVGNGGLSPFKNPPTSRKPTALKPVAKALDLEQAAAASKVEKRDMFGRIITSAQHAKNKGRANNKRPAGEMADKDAVEMLPVRFKYHEGVTDAVRRPVKVRDLL